MNYFYFFAFLFLSVLILIKPLVLPLANKFLKASNVALLGLITAIIGLFLIFLSTSYPYWQETLWTLVTFIIGILLVIRGSVIIFYFDSIKKILAASLRNYYKWAPFVSLAFISLAFLIITRDYLGPEKNIEKCMSDEVIDVICGFDNPEDIVMTPDGKWLVISELGGIEPFGKNESSFIKLMRLDDQKIIEPSLSFGKNDWGHNTCTRDPLDEFNTHGIDILEREDGLFQIGVINHKPRETVEMFELFESDNAWELRWRGCISADQSVYLNDITFLKNANFYATYMFDKGITWNEWLVDSLLKKTTGHVKFWDGDKFNIVPGSHGSQPNGIVLDEESNLIYIAYNSGDQVKIYNINEQKLEKSIFIEGPDNLVLDGDYIWATELNHQAGDSPTCIDAIACSLPFSIIKINKTNLEIEDKYEFREAAFGLPTVALPNNGIIYIGSFHADRIAFFHISSQK